MASRRGAALLTTVLLLASGIMVACGGDDPLEEIAPTLPPQSPTASDNLPVAVPTVEPTEEADAENGGEGNGDGAAAGAEEYTVQPGDTLGAIAAQFGVTVDAIAQLNDIADPNLIRPGDTLQIPEPE